ncbi:uncharacterized protein JN550_011793 [Neoarthrinium moseri]|uniref:uncharacterized protein n=1 Tax=Neoarthrinium moseri TaxID=1658444 RepID=UPI001FDCC53B|nr:uncharacterized protein JN550_011793 [Neoarthrinium moseri]KAI1859982.1 hypothetical protein JN550_011793 [Neoarthrinium moseri]
MASMTNDTCNGLTLSNWESQDRPTDITTGYILNGGNATYRAMQTCCSPNPVSVVDNCVVWCELPPAITDKGQNGTEATALADCLRSNGVEHPGEVGAAKAKKSSGGSRTIGRHPALPGLAVYALLGLWLSVGHVIT